ncbi:MAG: xanthine dehydrogenase family protein molybdopterin-binding subunit, partial [Pseudomonadota bacterium]
MSTASNVNMNRRRFIQVVSLGSAGFAVGCSDKPAATGTAVDSAEIIESTMNAFVKIASDNTITVVAKHLDKGQGVTTGLAAIVAEEIGADWSQMRTEFAPADSSRYNNLFFGPVQGTGGSTSIANSWTQLRTAAASAREMLRAAAAERWQTDLAATRVEAGRVVGDNREVSFGQLAEAAAAMTAPVEPNLKDPADFTLIGTHLPRLDSAGKTDGSAKFTIDLTRPGMRTAVILRPPKFGASVASYDAAAALAVPGVLEVVEVPRGVAVLADSYFSATRGRAALTVEWDEAGAEQRSSAQIRRDFAALLNETGLVARNDGNALATIDQAARTLSTEFEFPFLAHAPMEPLDCLVEISDGEVDIWTGSQLQTVDQNIAAQIAGVAPQNVRIHTQYAGGSFGRRAVPDSDFVAEAVSIAKAQSGSAPVKLIWSREDDITGGRYRPMALHRVRASVDDDGRITAWDHRIVSQSILKGTPFEAFMENGIDNSAVEGANDLPYAIPNMRVDLHLASTGVPVLWWRSVGHTHTAYATEVFLDQLAREIDRDPLELRRELLADQPRYLGVLNKAAEASGWGQTLEPGRGRGIAVHKSFNSYVAEVAEVSVAADGELRIERITCAVDCGIAVTPDVVRAQMEGGIGYGLSSALREAVTLTDGIVDQKNFDTYRPLRMHEMPKIDVHIVDSGEAPTGVGEPGTP